MKIEALYALYTQHYKVDTDTRKIRKNSIYFALKGANFNGNAFAEEALTKGASYAVVDEAVYATSDAIILVDDVLATLQKLAAYHRSQITFPILGLTGSNGKTTTKELIHCVLSKKFNAVATIGNLNNHIGVPLTILSFDKDTEFGIVEMGANHLKEIEFLCTIAQPDYGYITNFGKAHLEGFGGIDGVIKGKSELYQHLRKHQKSVFINPNDEKQVALTSDLTRIPFDASISLIATQPFLKISLKDLTIDSHLIGAYNFNNIACAITVGKHFNVSSTAIKEAISSYIPSNNRSQIITTDSNQIILDAYNANPTSVEAALRSFQSYESVSKTVVLGDMFELGEDAIDEHKKIADLAISLGFKNVFFVGEIYSKANTSDQTYASFEDLKNVFIQNPIQHNTILIKGSRGMALERLLEVIT
jgi:UDP-N-acetylmuramoyl-tripeptide--D-alanyl-D-alanine ligase